MKQDPRGFSRIHAGSMWKLYGTTRILKDPYSIRKVDRG